MEQELKNGQNWKRDKIGKTENGTRIEKWDKIGNWTEFKIRQKLKIKQKIENWTRIGKWDKIEN